MNFLCQLAVIVLILFAVPAIAERLDYLSSNNEMIPTMYSLAKQDKVVLVAFKDSGINRIRPARQYHSRGKYQSTTWSKRVGTQLAHKYGLTELAAWPVTELGLHCIVYQLPESLPMQQALLTIARDERLDLVQKMQFYHTRAHRYSDPYYKLQPHVHSMRIEKLHAFATGKNIIIALIDTGVDLKHPDLLGQISENHNYASTISPGFINDLHGTAVAGVMVAHAGNDAGIVGIAPDSKLLALKSCWSLKEESIEAVCNSFTLALAINKAIESGVDVLNLSLTGDHDPLLDMLISKAISKGIIVVAASEGSQQSGNFPASMTKVIGVRNNSSDSATINSRQMISAPGDEILTTFPKASYDFISGSSLSAAHISGIVALLLERNPKLTVDAVTTILNTTKVDDLYKLFN